MNAPIQGTGNADALASQRAEHEANGNPNPHNVIWKSVQAKSYPPGVRCSHPAIEAGWQNWFDLPFNPAFPPGGVRVGSGGFLQRTGQDTSGYMREGVVIYGLTRDTDLDWLAHQDPAIGAEWKRVTGFVPAPL